MDGDDERFLDKRRRSHGLTNGSWTDGGLSTCEPQACANLSLGSSVVRDCDETLCSRTGTVSCPSGYGASDMYDTVFPGLAPPCISDETLPRCVPLVGTGQEFDGLEDVAHTCDGVVSVIMAEWKAHMAWPGLTRVCGTTAPSSTVPSPRTQPPQALRPRHLPVDPVCEEKKCVDAACMDLTSCDQCKVMCAASYTGGARTLTCTIVVVNGSVSLIGILPNCPGASGVVDGIPCGMSNCCDGINCLQSRHGNRSHGYGTFDVTSATLSGGFHGYLVSNTSPFYPVCKSLSCPSSALLDDDTVEGLDRSFLTLGEACVETCADGYTTAGDAEIILTCFFDPESQRMVLEGSIHL